MRNFLSSCLLAIISLVIIVVLLEVAMRFMPAPAKTVLPIMKRDKALGVTLLPPNTTSRMFVEGDFDVEVIANKHGLRDKHDVATATENDILAIGDSYSMGWGVTEAERWSSVLARETGKRVFNLAMPANMDGYADYLRYANKLGSNAQTAVFGICMENDLLNYKGKQGNINRNEVDRTKHQKVNTVRYLLGKHSRLYQFIKSRIYAHEPLRRKLADMGIITKVTRHPAVVHVYDEDVINQSVDRLEKLVKGLDAYVLIIPSRALWFGGGEKSEQRIHDTFVSRIKQRGIQVIDMRQKLEASGDPKQYHFKHDGHWKAPAHKLAGKALAKAMKQ